MFCCIVQLSTTKMTDSILSIRSDFFIQATKYNIFVIHFYSYITVYQALSSLVCQRFTTPLPLFFTVKFFLTAFQQYYRFSVSYVFIPSIGKENKTITQYSFPCARKSRHNSYIPDRLLVSDHNCLDCQTLLVRG